MLGLLCNFLLVMSAAKPPNRKDNPNREKSNEKQIGFPKRSACADHGDVRGWPRPDAGLGGRENPEVYDPDAGQEFCHEERRNVH